MMDLIVVIKKLNNFDGHTGRKITRIGLIGLISIISLAGIGTAYAGMVLPSINLAGNVVADGDLDMTGGVISNILTPLASLDIATKDYADTNAILDPTTQAQIDNIESESAKIQMLKDDVDNLETKVTSLQQTLRSIEEKVFNLPPESDRADLSVTKTYLGIIFSAHFFEIVITNNGPDIASEVTFTDTATSTEFVPNFGTFADTICTTPVPGVLTVEITCIVGDISPGDTRTIPFGMASHPNMDNHVVVSSNTIDPMLGNNEDTVFAP